MGEYQISNPVSKALDLDPWGVGAPPGALDAPKRIPPTESAAIWLKTIVSPNKEMGQKDLSGSTLKLCMQHPNVCPEELRPKWLNGSICEIPPSESDDRWLNRSALAGSQMGWKETAIWIRISCSSPNPQTSLRPHWLSYALCNGYS
jgi:hypothetical protein